MKPLYTASALERVMACPTSVLLPQVWKSSPESQRGTSIHAFVRRCLTGMPIADALECVDPQWQETCRQIDFKKLGGDLREVRAEVAYAWDVEMRSARELGVNIARNYDVFDGEVPGTNDIEGMRMDEVPVVADIKTGEPVTLCEENPQLLYHALVRRQRTGAAEVQGRIFYIAKDGHVTLDAHTFDRFALDDFADAIEASARAINEAHWAIERSGTAPVNVGPWCRYCPALQACPAYVGLARRQVVELEDVRDRLQSLTPEQQGQAWVLGKQAETLADTVLSALKAIAKQTPFPLPDGGVVRAIQFPRDDFNRQAAVRLLRAKGATTPEIAALYKSHFVEQVRRFAPLGRPRKAKAKALPEVVEPDDASEIEEAAS